MSLTPDATSNQTPVMSCLSSIDSGINTKQEELVDGTEDRTITFERVIVYNTEIYINPDDTHINSLYYIMSQNIHKLVRTGRSSTPSEESAGIMDKTVAHTKTFMDYLYGVDLTIISQTPMGVIFKKEQVGKNKRRKVLFYDESKPVNNTIIKVIFDEVKMEQECQNLHHCRKYMSDQSTYISDFKIIKYKGLFFITFPEMRALNKRTFSAMNTSKDRLTRSISQMLRSLENLHSVRLIHNDIKLNNFLYDPTNDRYILVDYGNSCYINDNYPIFDVEKYNVNSVFDSQCVTFRPIEAFSPESKSLSEDQKNSTCTKARTRHITISCDIYAFGKMILRYDIVKLLNQQQREFIESMASSDITDRPVKDLASTWDTIKID